MKTYSYIIIRENHPHLAQESTLLDNNYKPSKKYAFIEKSMFKDGSETINRITYSNDLQELHQRAKGFISWYNYPLGISKDMQGNITELSIGQINYGNHGKTSS